MKKNNRNILSFLLLLLSFNASAQQISTGELNQMSQDIKKPYFTEPKAINDIIKQYLIKGFQLIDVAYTSDRSNNIHITVHKLDNILTQGKSETIIITTVDTNSIVKEAVIEFTTTDFSLYQKWYNSASTTYTEKKIEPMIYIYSNAQKTISLGAKNSISIEKDVDVERLHVKVDPIPLVYFLSVKYKLL